MKELTSKQRRFVSEYLLDLNATQAAMRAGYSEKNARGQASRLLTKANIKVAVAEGERRQLKAADVEKDRILQELKAIAFVRPTRSMLDEDGRILPPSEWPEDVHAAVKSYDAVTKNVTAGDGHQDKVIRASFWNKVGCLELLGKHFGVAQEDTETKMHEEIALALDQGRERCYRLGILTRPGTNGDDAPESG